MIAMYPPLPNSNDSEDATGTGRHSPLMNELHEDYLTCKICMNTYTTPKALPCLHTFCEHCLREYVSSRHYEIERHFPCPVCRADTDLPPEGVSGFQDNHMICSLQETCARVPECDCPSPDTGAMTSPAAQDVTSPASVEQREPQPKPARLCVGPPPALARIEHFYGAELCFGRWGDQLTDFTRPVGMAVTSSHIVVSDKRDNRLLVYETSGKIRMIFHVDGEVGDICATKDGHIVALVTKAGTAQAQRFTLDGRRVRVYTQQSSFHRPGGLAVSDRDELIVTSLEQRCVNVLSASGGKLIRRFGTRGNGPCHFLSPRHVTSGQHGRVVVSDTDAHTAQILDAKGKHVVTMGTSGSAMGQLLHPRGVCVDCHGNVIVCDSGNFRVQVFRPNGKPHGCAVSCTNLHPAARDVRPLAAALSRDQRRLVVLVEGLCYVQVRVFKYRSPGELPGNRCLCQ